MLVFTPCQLIDPFRKMCMGGAYLQPTQPQAHCILQLPSPCPCYRHYRTLPPLYQPRITPALANWGFMHTVFNAGHGGGLVKALGGNEQRSEYAEDTMR